ncbi:hypothetical protein PanWU01x14_354180, partial [Parasponia andersonii]
SLNSIIEYGLVVIRMFDFILETFNSNCNTPTLQTQRLNMYKIQLHFSLQIRVTQYYEVLQRYSKQKICDKPLCLLSVYSPMKESMWSRLNLFGRI